MIGLIEKLLRKKEIFKRNTVDINVCSDFQNRLKRVSVQNDQGRAMTKQSTVSATCKSPKQFEAICST